MGVVFNRVISPVIPALCFVNIRRLYLPPFGHSTVMLCNQSYN